VEARPGAHFCDACGQPLEAVARPAAAAVEGERRTVTVLFADAVGSTPVAERLGEEEMYKLMQGCTAHMVAAVQAFDGHVAGFTGDGIMAVFGAPVAQEESERRAVAAGLRMQRALADHATEVQDRHAVNLQFRVGLNTGPVVVGKVSDELTMEFTAIGDTVNLAARMQQLAAPGAVYLAEPTYRAVADHFECEAVGPLAVKGKGTAVAAWRAVREKPARTRLERAADRGLAPFVGRDVELAALETHLSRLREGRGQVVFIAGEAGMGKSRLLLEFRHAAGDRSRWLQGQCSSFGQSSPYLPVIDLLKHVFGVEEADSEADMIGRIDRATSGWDRTSRATVPYLRYLLSVEPGDPRVASMDPRERRAGIVDGLRALLREESRRSPLVIVIEDLHWVDAISEQALSAVIDAVPSMPVLLLLTHRPGSAGALERTSATRLVLEPLAHEQSAELIRGVLGVGALPAELERLVAGKAEGNPFYTEEVVRSLLEAGVLARANGGFALTRTFDDLRIPDTVQEVILSRIDRLERPARAALQLASVIGREFTLHLLERISDLEARLQAALAELKTLELIFEKAWFPELAYMFKHALTHDVAYSTLVADRRRRLHRLVAEAVEELYAERLAEHYETLAHHYSEAEEWTKALDYLGRAGDKAAAAFANQDALDYYARALAVCERLGDATVEIQAAVARKRSFVSFGIGRFAEAAKDMERVLAVARTLEDQAGEAQALVHRGMYEHWNHQSQAAEATLLSAMALARDRFPGIAAQASVVLILVYVALGRHADLEPALDVVRRHASDLDPFGRGLWAVMASRVELWAGRVEAAVRLAEEHRPATEAVMAHRLLAQWNEAHARASLGDYETALRLLEETIALCERVGDMVVRVRCLNTLGYVFAELGDLATAMDWNQRGVEMAVAMKAPVREVEMNARLNVAENLLGQGRLDEAEPYFRAVEEVVRDPREIWMGWRYGERFLHSFGEWWLAGGDPVQGRAHADECLEWAQRSGSRKNIVKAGRLRGQCALAQDRWEEADDELTAALELAREVGSPPQVWTTLSCLGDLRSAQGRPQEARRLYDEALSVVEEVASRLSDPDLRATFLGSAPVEALRRRP
jgi:class 3 adenylate cyclase/tetratricopeptide (TPR) repeat protein